MARIGIFNMTLPAEGPIALPENVDFQTVTETEIDFTQAINDKTVSFITGVWVDNFDNGQDLIIETNAVNQRVIAPANSQGWYQLMVGEPPVFKLRQNAIGGIVRLVFVNYPVFPFIWTP